MATERIKPTKSLAKPTKALAKKPPSALRVLDPTIKPWFKQSFETAEQFNTFQVYLAMGPERSLLKLTQLLGEQRSPTKALKEPRKNVSGYLSDWSSQCLWVIRCQAYDVHLSEIRFKSFECEVENMARRQARQFCRLQEMAAKGLDAYEKAGGYPTKWTDITMMLDAGAKAERAAMGIVDIPVPTQTSNFNFSNLTSSELEQFIALHSKLSQHQIGQASDIIDMEE